MITSKQRSVLNKIGQKLQPTVHIGKNGVADTVIKDTSDQLTAKEIVKVAVLKNSLIEAKELASELATALFADVVSCVGSKIVLYRKSDKKGITHIDI